MTGEANKIVGVDYMCNAFKLLRPYFSNISIEIQPLDQDEYEKLIENGLYATLVYQETYHRETYKIHHLKERSQILIIGWKPPIDWEEQVSTRSGSVHYSVWKIGGQIVFSLFYISNIYKGPTGKRNIPFHFPEYDLSAADLNQKWR